RATAILAYLPQELLGTSCYEYFHQDDIGHLAECHRQVLQTREKITTNCYKFKIKDGSFITLRSRWFSFMNPWTKEVEYIVSTNTVVLSRVDTGHLGQVERCTVLSRPDSRFLIAGMFTEPTSWKAGTQPSHSSQHPPTAWTACCPLEKVAQRGPIPLFQGFQGEPGLGQEK
ncbi:ARNTL isoform 1, partial [Pan troglodytes]